MATLSGVFLKNPLLVLVALAGPVVLGIFLAVCFFTVHTALLRPGLLMGCLVAILAASTGFLSFLLWRLGRQNRERGKTMDLLCRTGEIQSFLAQVNQRSAEAEDEAGFLQDVCDLAIRKGGMAMAAVARPAADGRLLFPAAAGQTACLEDLEISILPGVPEGHGPAGKAWREKTAVFSTGSQKDWLAPWRPPAMQATGIRMGAILPVAREGRIWALLLLSQNDGRFFELPVQGFFVDLAADVGRVLERIAHSRQLRLLDAAAAAFSDGIVIADAAQNVIFVNAGFSTMSGYLPEEVLGRNCRLLQGPDTDPETVRRIHETLESGQSFDGEIRNVRRDGSTFWNRLHIDPVTDAKGRITHFIGIQRDITREREALDMQAALLQNTASGILVARQRTIITANATMAQMLGREAQTLPGQSTRILYRDDVEFVRVGMLLEHLSSDGAAYMTGVRIQCADGTFLLCDLQGRLLADGQTSVWTFSDVTERESQTRQLQRAQGVYHALAAAAESLLQGETERDMISRLCERLLDGTGFAEVWIACPDVQGLFQTVGRAARNAGHPAAPGARYISVNDPEDAVAMAWRSQGAVIHQEEEDRAGGRHASRYTAPRQQRGWPSNLAVPVHRRGKPWGVLVLAAARAGSFDENTRVACEQVAALLGFGLEALDRRQALQALQHGESRRARTDALTGLPNRLALEEYLPQALARASRQQKMVAVGLLDLDDFKPVNDRFGHAAGDSLLQGFARALQELVRQTDFVGRLGGDEFVVVFEDLEPADAFRQIRIALNRLHAAVELPFALGEGRSAHVGMTMGLAFYPQDAEEPRKLLGLADVAMYACKSRKMDRSEWWCIGSSSAVLDNDQTATAFGAFDSRAAALLQDLDPRWLESVEADFTSAFYRRLREDSINAQILNSLSPEEIRRLKNSQATHLRFLLHPETTREALEEKAASLGQVHALVGVSGAALEEASGLYGEILRTQLEKSAISPRQRYLTLRVAAERLRLDLQGQLAAFDQTTDAYYATLKTQFRPSSLWVDELPTLLQKLGDLPGLQYAVIFRPDEQGRFRILTGAGADFPRLWNILRSRELYPSISPVQGKEEPGPLAMAWLSRQVQVVDAYLLDGRLKPWYPLAQEFGWRSAATVPIIASDHDMDSVLMLFGAFPHQFSSHWAKSWLSVLHSHLNTLFAAAAHAHPLIAQDAERAFRLLLYGEGLQMWVQPIVDLQTGTVSRVEVLARLHAPDGTVFLPGQFLPAFGQQELKVLFHRSLRRALSYVHEWRERGLDIDISVNLPPSVMVHPECASWVQQELGSIGVPARHLILEILETEDLDHARGNDSMHALRKLGVRLALDDFGSGYGSMTRLASLPIDTVKIDQALIRDFRGDPIKTIQLLVALVRIGLEFAQTTIIEGLEDEGVTEVARLAGAGSGQGFWLARPMPVSDFPGWLQTRPTIPADPGSLHTWHGALAYHWLGMHDFLSPRHPGPIEHCLLTRFFRTEGVADPEVLLWHEQIHGRNGGKVQKEAASALLEWLVRKVRQMYVQ